MVNGQRFPTMRPRLRECGGKELPLGSYPLLQKASRVEETVWSNVMRGLSMRHYKEVLQQFADAYGLEKSTVSEHFLAASRKKLDELMNRSLAHLPLCAVVIDGTIFKGQQLGGSHRHRHARPQDRAGVDSTSDGECDGGERLVGSTECAWAGLRPAPFVSAGGQ